MMEIERPRIDTTSLSPDGRYGKFVVEPLERGFGTTLGNSLRRVLLSSLPGVAVTSVKIDGVVHEFSTIPGVKEDVTEIVLNLKGIAAKLYADGPVTVRIEASGEGEVTAGSIKPSDEIEVLNPEWHIATLEENGKLVMELTFDKGRGYVPAERNKQAVQEKNDLNVLPIDSIYTPVLKVNYTVENTRVGQITDYDKLTLEVWTDGTINAKEAVSLAARVLTEHLNLFVNLSEEAMGAEIMVEKQGQGEGPGDDHRRAGSERAFLQLPEACRHQHRGRLDQQVRGRNDESSEPRPQKPGRSHGKAGLPGLHTYQRRRVITAKE